MRRAHDEAVDAIFVQKVKAHHHMQAYTSRKTGRTKWGELEMWPVHVSSSTSCGTCILTGLCFALVTFARWNSLLVSVPMSWPVLMPPHATSKQAGAHDSS